MSAWKHTWREHVEKVQEHARTATACPDCHSPQGHSCTPLDQHPHDARLRAAKDADPGGAPYLDFRRP